MELIIFKTCLEVFKELFDIFKDVKNYKDDSRKEIVNWILEVADLINHVADKIEAKQFPQDSCAHLSFMIDDFEQTLSRKGYLSDSKFNQLIDKLKRVKEIERLYGEINNSSETDRIEHIKNLKEAVGTLRGISSIIKYSN